MKKKLLLLLLLPLFLHMFAFAGNSSKRNKAENSVSAKKLSTIITKYKNCPGVQSLNIGSFGTGLIKTGLKIISIGDEDAKNVIKLTRGIKGIYLFEYDECCDEDKKEITRSINKIVKGTQPLMELNDDGDKMCIYGIYNEQTDMVKDLVLYTPSDCALICLRGEVSIEDALKIAEYD